MIDMFNKIIGTGGIGKGILFQINENTDIGRNESRLAELTDAKDYCKLHIVFHYLGVMLSDKVPIYAIGKIGNDAYGKELITMMKAAGINTKWVSKSVRKPTMLSVCYQYPDKTGGNITAGNSSCAEVTPEYIYDALVSISPDEHTLAVALPEVPLSSRIELLRQCKEKSAFCIACNNSSEIEEFIEKNGIEYCDLLAMNDDECRTLMRVLKIETSGDISAGIDKLLKRYPDISLWITQGSRGAIFAKKGKLVRFPILRDAKVINTAGAGDASLAGLIAGMYLYDEYNNPEKAGKLAMTMAGMSVESADSIAPEITVENVKNRTN